MISVQVASARVGSTRWAISSATVFLKKKLSPKLPCRTLPIQMANCVPDRLVEPELVADVGDLVGGGVVAGDHRRRIARRQPQHEEDEHRHHREHGDDGDETTGDEIEHFSSCMHLAAFPLRGDARGLRPLGMTSRPP